MDAAKLPMMMERNVPSGLDITIGMLAALLGATGGLLTGIATGAGAAKATGIAGWRD